MVGGNKEQSICAIERGLSKEEQMGLCHFHNALCECVFAGNVVDGVEDVAMWKISNT